MRLRLVIKGLLFFCTIAMIACEPDRAPRWVLLSSDSDGRPTSIDAESIRMRDEGVAVYSRVVGEPSADDRIQLVQGLDCVNLRWAFLSLDESLLDSIAGEELAPEEWSLLELNPANRVLLDEVCEGFTPDRWIRVLKKNTDVLGDLREVWVDRETLNGPGQDTIHFEGQFEGEFEGENDVVSGEVFHAWSRWYPVSPDSGYVMLHTAVACDQGAYRYFENSSYTREGGLIRQAETLDSWFSFFEGSFDLDVHSTICEMGRFFEPELNSGG